MVCGKGADVTFKIAKSLPVTGNRDLFFSTFSDIAYFIGWFFYLPGFTNIQHGNNSDPSTQVRIHHIKSSELFNKSASSLPVIRIHYQQYKDPTMIKSKLQKLTSIEKVRYEGLNKLNIGYVILINNSHLSRKLFDVLYELI